MVRAHGIVALLIGCDRRVPSQTPERSGMAAAAGADWAFTVGSGWRFIASSTTAQTTTPTDRLEDNRLIVLLMVAPRRRIACAVILPAGPAGVKANSSVLDGVIRYIMPAKLQPPEGKRETSRDRRDARTDGRRRRNHRAAGACLAPAFFSRWRLAALHRGRSRDQVFPARSDQRVQFRQARSGLALQDRQPGPATRVQAGGHAARHQRRVVYDRRDPALRRRPRWQDR